MSAVDDFNTAIMGIADIKNDLTAIKAALATQQASVLTAADVTLLAQSVEATKALADEVKADAQKPVDAG